MRICVLQSAYPDGHPGREYDPGYHPEFHVSTHSFEHRWIRKETAVQDIDSAIEEKFDIYFSFMWGLYKDNIAGIEAVQYLESRVPSFIGVPSRALLQNKHDFYEASRARGKPNVPGNDLSRYPVFVKPTSGCCSEGVDNSSLCWCEDDLDAKIHALDVALEPERQSQGIAMPAKTLCKGTHRVIPNDILVTEYVPGADYFVIVCKVGGIAMALCPERWCLPTSHGKCQERFLTQELKCHPNTQVKTVDREESPSMYDALQATALEAWEVADNGADWGHVDMRVRPTGDVVAIEVNPMPGIFTPPEKHQWDDPAVSKSFPGGHRSLVNCAIAGRRLQRAPHEERASCRETKIAAAYDTFANDYNKDVLDYTKTVQIIQRCVSDFSFRGKILDLACGTGAFGRILAEHTAPTPETTITGIEISAGMAQHARATGAYASVVEGSMQEHQGMVPGPVDHVVSFYALQFLDPIDLDFVLTSAFLTATMSLTFSVDEIPGSYNDALRQSGGEHMVQYNHLQTVEEFGVPLGWKLAFKKRFFAWKSWHTGHEVYTTVFRFEKQEQGTLVSFAACH